MRSFTRGQRRLAAAVVGILVVVGVAVVVTRGGDGATTSLATGGTTTSTIAEEAAGASPDTTSTSTSTTSTSAHTGTAPPTTLALAAPGPIPALAPGFGSANWLAYGLSGSTHLVAADGSGDYELSPTNGLPHWSHDRRHVVVAGHAQRPGTWVIGADRQTKLVDLPEGAGWPTFTADDKHILAVVYRHGETGPTWTIRRAPVDGGPDTVVLACACGLNMPVAAPDGTAIAFLAGDGTQGRVRLMNPDGTNVRDVPGSHDTAFGLDWTPDSQSVVYEYGADVWLLNVRTGARLQLTNTPVRESLPAVSPDGRKVAFRVEGAPPAIETMNIDGTDRRRIVEAPIYTLAW